MRKVKYFLLLVALGPSITVVLLLGIFPSGPRIQRGYGADFTHENLTAFSSVAEKATNNSNNNNNNTTGLQNLPKDEKRLVHLYQEVNLTGPTMHPILSEVEWLEDLSHLNICNKSDPFILAVVFSAIPNAQQRQLIRTTWADPKLYMFTKIRAIFVLGATTNSTLQKMVEEEISQHQDIIQYNYIDSYRNLTYKTISWVTWVQQNCLDVPWIAKIDDDIVVNPFSLNRYLVEVFKKNPAPNAIHGRVRDKNKAMRKGKWAVTEEEYPPTKYPPFVLGPAYIVGRNAIDKLLEYTPYTPFLWLEDVYMTGLVAHAAGIKHVQAERVLYTKKLTRRLYHGPMCFLVGASEKTKKAAWSGIIRYNPAKKRK